MARNPKKQEAAELSLLKPEEGAEALIIDADAPGLMLVTDEQLIKAEADGLAMIYADFTIESVRSKEDYDKFTADLRALVRGRNKLDKRRLKVNRDTNAVAAMILGWFAPVEEKLAKVKAEYDRKEADRIRIAAEERANVIKGREAVLYGLGATWGGSMFQLGLVMATKADIEDDARWRVLLAEFGAEAERIAAKAKADAEREAAEAEERDRVAAETTRLQNEAAAKLAEAEKKAEAAMVTLRKARAAILAGLGAVRERRLPDGTVVDGDVEGAVLGMALGDLFATRLELELEDEEWDGVVADFTAEKQRLADQIVMDAQIEKNETTRAQIGASAYEALRNGRSADPVVEPPVAAPDPVVSAAAVVEAETPAVAEAPVVPVAPAPKFVPVHPGQVDFPHQSHERAWLSGYHAALTESRGKTSDEIRVLFAAKRAQLGL